MGCLRRCPCSRWSGWRWVPFPPGPSSRGCARCTCGWIVPAVGLLEEASYLVLLLALLGFRLLRRRDRFADRDLLLDPGVRIDQLGHALVHVGVGAEERLRVLAALPDARALEAVPGAALLQQTELARQVENVALARDAVVEHQVELRLAERRRALVLHDLHARAAADRRLAVLDLADAAHVEAHGGVELQRVPARRGL